MPHHDILIAEGALAESSLDTGNRGSFANASKATTLPPAFARTVWDQQGCAPLVTSEPDWRWTNSTAETTLKGTRPLEIWLGAMAMRCWTRKARRPATFQRAA